MPPFQSRSRVTETHDRDPNLPQLPDRLSQSIPARSHQLGGLRTWQLDPALHKAVGWLSSCRSWSSESRHWHIGILLSHWSIICWSNPDVNGSDAMPFGVEDSRRHRDLHTMMRDGTGPDRMTPCRLDLSLGHSSDARFLISQRP